MIISAKTDIGAYRESNQDAFATGTFVSGDAWAVVCDGMGGHAMGEVASETICNAVCDYWLRSNNEDSVVKARRACRSASGHVVCLRYSGL